MGLGIVADINSARAQQGEHFVKQDMLADAAIGEHEVQGIRRLALHRRPGVLGEDCQPGVPSQMRSSDGLSYGLISTVSNCAVASRPSSNQQVPTPVPVPTSSSRPPGFKLAMTRSKAPTGGQHQL